MCFSKDLKVSQGLEPGRTEGWAQGSTHDEQGEDFIHLDLDENSRSCLDDEWHGVKTLRHEGPYPGGPPGVWDPTAAPAVPFRGSSYSVCTRNVCDPSELSQQVQPRVRGFVGNGSGLGVPGISSARQSSPDSKTAARAKANHVSKHSDTRCFLTDPC